MPLKRKIARSVSWLLSDDVRQKVIKATATTTSAIAEAIPEAAAAAMPHKRKRTRDKIKTVAGDISQGVGILAIVALIARFFARRMRNGG